MKTTKYAIVHIADIHYRKETPEGASSIIKAFLKDLEEQISIKSDYQFIVAITGDIVQEGCDLDSYVSFINELDNKLSAMGLPKTSRLLVPGNHDIDRNLVAQKLDIFRDKHNIFSKDEAAFNDELNNCNTLSSKFENYELFAMDFTDYSEPHSILGWGKNINKELGVYFLNTALCSFGGLNGIDDDGELAICTRNLVSWCNSQNNKTNILLMHHPIENLNAWSKRELQNIIDEHFAICLCGHSHLTEVYTSKVPPSSYICVAPPLFCGKENLLAYSIIEIEENEPSKIFYREYSNGKFFPSHSITKNESGAINLDNVNLNHLKEFEGDLNQALTAYKGQPIIFIEPHISESREFNDKENLVKSVIDTPENILIIAPPQFGLSCLGRYMRWEALKSNNFWLHIDMLRENRKNIHRSIEKELLRFNRDKRDVRCVIIDNWDKANQEYKIIAANLDQYFDGIPLIFLSSENSYSGPLSGLEKLQREFRLLHLQALKRNSIRQFVSHYNSQSSDEEELLSLTTSHLESLNIHRTALNCHTLLRVHQSGYSEKLLNKAKLMKAILFVLFTDPESFSYSSSKPEVDDCTYVLGWFCKKLIENCTRSFDIIEFKKEIKDFCEKNYMTLNVEAMMAVLIDNNILIKYGNTLEFKHRYWVFYFAAEYMHHDAIFKEYILQNRRYTNFPEIMDFYSGSDGKREDVLEILHNDLQTLISEVDDKIGIKGEFNPLSKFLWSPSDQLIEETRVKIAERIESSNLPAELKDQQADKHYDSNAPYNQSINNFLNEYSVICLMGSISASSRALRNSTFVKPDLKLRVAETIFKAWEEISKVIFWLSPILAINGRAMHDGFSLVLSENFSSDPQTRFKQIITSNPNNVVRLLKDDLSSQKVGKLLYELLKAGTTELQKHYISIFLLEVRPSGWFNNLLEHLNLLHPSSYYLGDLLSSINTEIQLGSLKGSEEAQLKQLVSAILAKRRYASKALQNRTKAIPSNMILHEENKLPRDQLLANYNPNSPDKYSRTLN